MNEPPVGFVAYPRDKNLTSDGAVTRLLDLAEACTWLPWQMLLNLVAAMFLLLAVEYHSVEIFLIYLALIGFACMVAFRTARRFALGMDCPRNYIAYSTLLVLLSLAPLVGTIGLASLGAVAQQEMKRYGVQHSAFRSFRGDVVVALEKHAGRDPGVGTESWAEPPK